MNNYTELSIAELRALLRAKNVAGYSSMRKADMVSLLESMDSAEAAPAKPVAAETKKSAVAKTKNPLRQGCRKTPSLQELRHHY